MMNHESLLYDFTADPEPSPSLKELKETACQCAIELDNFLTGKRSNLYYLMSFPIWAKENLFKLPATDYDPTVILFMAKTLGVFQKGKTVDDVLIATIPLVEKCWLVSHDISFYSVILTTTVRDLRNQFLEISKKI